MQALFSIAASMLGPSIKHQLRNTIGDGALYLIAALMGSLSFAFIVLALFLVLQEQFGSLEAAAMLALGAFAITMLLILIVHIRKVRRRRIREARIAARKTAQSEAALTGVLVSTVAKSPTLMMTIGAGLLAAAYVTSKGSSSHTTDA